MTVDLERVPKRDRRGPSLAVTVLGAVTIAAYGVAYYSYGALIDPIHADTGWSQAALGAVFSAVLVIGGVGGLAGGRLVDRLGTRSAFALAASVGAGAIVAASFSHRLLAFAAVYALGCGVMSALGFYHVTQPAAIRASPGAAARAVVWLTILGAFASPLFLPLTSALVDAVGWRATLRIEAAIAAGVFAVALVPAAGSTHPRGHTVARPDSVRDALRGAWRVPGFRSWIAASMVAGAAVDIVLVYQVPIMIAAGLPTGAASAIGGLRGLTQLAGRLPLGSVLRRAGSRRTVILAFACAALGTACLLASGHMATAVTFSVIAGTSIGAMYTLQGIYTNELVGQTNLSLLMGAQQALFATGGAIGPVLAGAVVSGTGSYTIIVAVTAIAFATAAAIMTAPRARSPHDG